MADTKTYKNINEALKDRTTNELNNPCSTMGGISEIYITNSLGINFFENKNKIINFAQYSDYLVKLNENGINALIDKYNAGQSVELDLHEMEYILALAPDETICKLTDLLYQQTERLIQENQEFINKNETNELNLKKFNSNAKIYDAFIDNLNVITENAELSFESNASETNETTGSLFDKLRKHVVSKQEKSTISNKELEDINHNDKAVQEEKQLSNDEEYDKSDNNQLNDGMDDDSMDDDGMDDGAEMVREITRD